jgi:hypothetical protein
MDRLGSDGHSDRVEVRVSSLTPFSKGTLDTKSCVRNPGLNSWFRRVCMESKRWAPTSGTARIDPHLPEYRIIPLTTPAGHHNDPEWSAQQACRPLPHKALCICINGQLAPLPTRSVVAHPLNAPGIAEDRENQLKPRGLYPNAPTPVIAWPMIRVWISLVPS